MKNQKKLALFTSLTLLSCLNMEATPYQYTPADVGSGVQSGQGTQMPEGLTAPVQDTIWTQDTLTGDWDGYRNQLAYKGVSFTLNYQAEVFGNPVGGQSQGTISDGLFNLTTDLDLDRITGGFWKDATVQANFLYIYGPGLSASHVGDFSNTSNLSGPTSVRLQELWFEQDFWLKRASLRVGMLAADTEFFTSSSSALFLNGTFGAFNLIGQNFPNAPVYPLSRPGIRLYVAPTSKVYLRAAIFGMDSNLDAGGNDLHGTYFDINNGALAMVEAGYLLNQSPNDLGLQGTYKIGTFFQNGSFTTWQSQAQNALGTGGLSQGVSNYAVYGVADQQIYQKNDSVVSVFARGGFSPAQYSFISGYLDAGFNFTGFIPGRASDIAGLAVAYSPVSKDFSNAQVEQGGSPYTQETVLEATYQVHLAPWWTIQPDVQFILNPSGIVGSANALVLGMRSSINF